MNNIQIQFRPHFIEDYCKYVSKASANDAEEQLNEVAMRACESPDVRLFLEVPAAKTIQGEDLRFWFTVCGEDDGLVLIYGSVIAY